MILLNFVHLFFKMGQTGLFLFILSFSHDKYIINTINDKSVDGVIGTRTWGSRMVGTDESSELWQHCAMAALAIFYLVVKVSLDFAFPSRDPSMPYYPSVTDCSTRPENTHLLHWGKDHCTVDLM